ncbi:MAG: S1 family peptidase, partial [Gemmatimonadales bacterium]
PYLRAQGIAPANLRVRRGDFDYTELERWFGQATVAVLALPGAVFVDADEAHNRVRIGVDRGAVERMRGVVAGLGIPVEAVLVEETEPIRFAATLRSRVRPIVGGLQINFPGFLCTLGFNAVRSGQNSFITNSHCTKTQGGTESTPYWQPLESVDPTRIGTEVDDPVYSRNVNGCPSGRRCRRSDAARAAYATGISFTRGSLAKTSGPNNNSITITGSFTITAEGSASVGQQVNKVGRTTGWTQGNVTNTCVNTFVSGSNIVQLCQTFVSARVGGGDSGSPVFRGSSSVTLVGILWGGNSSGTTFVYSPISNIEQELGSLTTF